MNIPPFSNGITRVEDWSELKDRLLSDEVPFPDQSLRLLAYMVWPEDPTRRSTWMASQIGLQLVGKTGTADPAKIPLDDIPGVPLAAQNMTDEYFALFGGNVLPLRFTSDQLHKDISERKSDWLRVADFVQYHIAISRNRHAQERGGSSINKIAFLLSENIEHKPHSIDVLSAIWRQHRSVAHLIASAVALSAEARNRNKTEEWKLHPDRLQFYNVVMQLPEAVLGFAQSLQTFGLQSENEEQHFLPAAEIWRIPSDLVLPSVELPNRSLTRGEAAKLRQYRAPRR